MKTKNLIKAMAFAMGVLLFPLITNAQKMRKSPHDTVTATVAGANLKITYGSPAVNGRTIWGSLEPWDKPWRGGADEATTFTTDKDIMVGGKKLPAGTYTVFLTPGKDMWIYTFNSQTGQWGIKRDGSANFDETKNVLTVMVKPQAVEMTEHLKYVFSANSLAMRWDKIEVPVTIQ
jgi:hypothetical protein